MCRTFGRAPSCDAVEMPLLRRRPAARSFSDAGHYAAARSFHLIAQRPKAALGQQRVEGPIKLDRHSINVELLVTEHALSSAAPPQKLRAPSPCAAGLEPELEPEREPNLSLEPPLRPDPSPFPPALPRLGQRR